MSILKVCKLPDWTCKPTLKSNKTPEIYPSMDLMHHLARVWLIGACTATVQSGVVILDVAAAHRIQKKIGFVLCKLINLELCIFYR